MTNIKTNPKIALIFMDLLVILFLLYYFLTYTFGFSIETIESDIYGLGFLVLISLMVGIIRETIGEPKKYPLSLWSFSHLVFPTWLFLIIFSIFNDMIITIISTFIIVSIFEIFEYFLSKINMQTRFTFETKFNTIIDFILHIIGITIGFYWLV